MATVRVLLVVFAMLAVLPGGAGAMAQPTSADGAADALSLARFVERRAGSTTFAELDAFGRAALQRDDREGLNRLYHVAWTTLNQGEFERAALWNRRLAEAAARQGDERYLDIARLNDLTIRYDQGDTAVAGEMMQMATTGRDWFVRAHAARLAALWLMDQARTGEALDLLSTAEAGIADDEPFADTAHAGIWEVAGMGLKDLNDVVGAAAAFRKFEIEYSNPEYPRPDFDSLYNLTVMAVQVGDLDRAVQYYAAHHRLARRAGLETLSVYDANLCATVAHARGRSREALACLGPYGEDLGAAAFLALDALPIRGAARARTGDIAGARRDLETLRRLEAGAEVGFDSRGLEAEILLAEGRPADAYRLLRDYAADSEVRQARQFSAGIHQVTGNMQQQLAERRRQLETARANTGLQQGIIAIGVVFLLSAAATVAWQARQARRLKAAQHRAEEANRSKSEFLANMSHEIRTPLNGVVSMADALARRELQPQEHEMVELIRSSSATLERLLSDILDSARIESGQVAIERAPFDLEQAVRDVAALWRARAEETGVALEVEFDPALAGRVEGDPVRVRQVLTNLVSNALKFTSEGYVRVSVAAGAGDVVAFRVEDTGVGFDATQKARIFGRFQQADGSITRRYGGTGLGLAISSALVELMGGALDCDSTPGEGSAFWFDIPLPRLALAPVAAVADPAVEGGDAPLRILLADDHPANRKVVEIMLSATPMELVSVEDGRQAVEAFGEGGFDLVLMDMQMPVMDGLSATRAIRALEAEQGRARTPVIMLTANAMAEHIEAGRAAGADGHLAKPVTMDTLFAAIETAMSAPELEAA